MANVTISVELSLRTCGACGSVYGVPSWVGFARCPMCAGRRMESLEARVEALTRTERALRGAVKRARRKAA